MLADPRSEALIANFAGQWLNLRALEGHVAGRRRCSRISTTTCGRPSGARPSCSSTASCTRTAASSICSTADYTFVNERLAKHYGIPNVYGSRFRRVTLGPELDMRRGLLGKGALLTVTSQPGRTSPVIRGKWVLQNLPRRAAAAAAAGRARAQAGDRGRDGQQREARRCASSMELHRTRSRVRELPQDHRADRPRARELRRGRRLADDGRRREPIDASSVLSTARRSTARRACATRAELLGPVRARRDREAADLRARPRRRVPRHAARAHRSCATRRATTIASTR